MGCSKWKVSVPDMTFRTWHFKKKKKITSLQTYLKRSMPETLFGTLTNLLYSVQKNLSTLIIQKPVKWFAVQNIWLVFKPSTFLVKSLSKQTLANVPFKQTRYSIWFLLAKYLKKHLWKSDILSKDPGHWPVSLYKMSLYHRYFLAYLPVKTNYLVSYSCV